ncbi:hypothetical protein PHJA_001385600 [Phtheirospermum japonicum]|uniref:Uncharacterized protein n=1 Tax=Phtheirospermum japonicum TaxID=374723 RepID=A0A830C7R2_9LAMI|nr:hypothetical protein PHJA_001385600 [Phtheirospermum japonicum]
MILLSPKLTCPFKFPSKLENNHHPINSLRNFRSKISEFITQILSEPDPTLHKCFELINITNRAFAKMVVEIGYPTTRWSESEKLTDQYLTYTLNLLGLLNSVSSSLSHLSHAKISVLHALTLIKNNSPSSAAKHLKKIPRKNLNADFNFDGPVKIEGKPGSETERVVLRALAVSKKVEFLAIGFVLSSLCGDAKPYMEIRKRVGGFGDDDDAMIKEMDSRFCKEVSEIEQGKMEEVKEVNSAIDRLYAAISNGRCCGDADDLMKRLEVLQNLIQGLEKQANNLFSEVLGTRNKLLDNLRFTGHNT